MGDPSYGSAMSCGKIKRRGIFDFDKVYKEIIKWFTENMYVHSETMYKHKPPDEYEIKEQGWRKITPYHRYWVFVRIYMLDAEEVEVVHKGKKKRMMQGRIEITFKFFVQEGYEQRWEESAFFVKLRKFFNKYIMKHRSGLFHSQELNDQVIRYMDHIKKTLDNSMYGTAY